MQQPVEARRAKACAVDAALHELLAGADFADAYCVQADDTELDAITAARRAMARPPRWVTILMTLRDILVTPLRLRTRFDRTLQEVPRIGAFPILSETPDRVVMGLDDRHLDFRLVIDIRPGDGNVREVMATTLVRTNNRLGQAYLAVVMPFHRLIVPNVMTGVRLSGQG